LRKREEGREREKWGPLVQDSLVQKRSAKPEGGTRENKPKSGQSLKNPGVRCRKGNTRKDMNRKKKEEYENFLPGGSLLTGPGKGWGLEKGKLAHRT